MEVRNGALRALGSGAVGAVALNAVHEIARRTIPGAPRMDVVGMRALARTLAAVGQRRHGRRRLFRETLAGDLIANSLYYSLVGGGPRDRRLRRGLALGLAAGIGGVVMPPRLGLGRQPSAGSPATAAMTIAWYTLGGVAAALAGDLFRRRPAPA